MKIKLNNAIRSQLALLTGFTGLDTAIENYDIENSNEAITMLNGYCTSTLMLENMKSLVLDKIASNNVGFYPSEAISIDNLILSATDFTLQLGKSLQLDRVANAKAIHFEFAKAPAKRTIRIFNALDIDEDSNYGKQVAMFELKRGNTSASIELNIETEAELTIAIDDKELYIKSLAVEGYPEPEIKLETIDASETMPVI